MLNPDGVFLGNQRSDLLGSDLNRCWHRTTTYAHPALVAVKEMLMKYTAEKSMQLDFIIDIHADVSHEGVFVRGNSYDDVYRFERHAVLPKFLGARIEAWKQENCLYNADANATGSARRSLPTGNIDAYTLLASLGGRRLQPRGPYIHYTEDACVVPPRECVPSKKRESRRRRRRKPPERGRSPSSSPERRAVRARVLSPPLPPASPPTHVPPRPYRQPPHRARPRTSPYVDPLLPLVTGVAVQTPRLTVVDMSASVRVPSERAYLRVARPPRPAHAKFTSDEYDTLDSDS
ncbi:hypothetical protein EVAR_3218_1 [Eumeta japonica]|uniref:Peptidase M14 domain-containing protein n=1 Tax=Eumeta variegata TaxID=151549 RepID=A0A4C1SUS8_EUMVA|nr:hypothetical protein EVAR_3218_1 [Eumeta japonica]